MSTAVDQDGFRLAGSRAVRQKGKTKGRILAAARKHFAVYGYERATIRAIARQAGIDPAMVMRYFGTKEKLFAAAAEFDLRLPDLAAVPRDAIGSLLVGHFLDRWESDDTLQALLRAAVSHHVAVARLRAIFATQVVPALAPLWRERPAGGATGRLGPQATPGSALVRPMLWRRSGRGTGRGG